MARKESVSMSTDDIEREFKFLSDDTVADDDFGSHSRVAGIIAQKMKAGKFGMSIGLEGTWGSGKSSVIKMLEDKLSDSPDIRVFTFDAWDHEGDSLRRSFLEELITDLQEGKNGRPWLGSGNKELDCVKNARECCRCEKETADCPNTIRRKLRRRDEHNDVTSTPILKVPGFVFGAATVLMAVGIAFRSTGSPRVGTVFISPLLAIMLYVLLAILILKPIYLKRERRDPTKKVPKWVDLEKYCGEFFGNHSVATTQSTRRGVEPTSIEFREYYRKILKLCLGDDDGRKERKLVIVLDNLDRVSGDLALKAWSTMRTFVRPGDAKADDLRSKVWLIVPYDADTIEKLWHRDDAQGGKSGNGQDGDLARAFREKTFQVRYRVAPPLASKWARFFTEQLGDALPGESYNTRQEVYHVFRKIAVPTYDGVPTPRAMKMFINRLLALAQQHFPDVSVVELALYAALELTPTDPFKDLVVGNPLEPEWLVRVVGEQWREGLAAVHFGVPREFANEVLFEPMIRTYLSEGRGKELAELLEKPGAKECCERHLSDNAAGFSFDELTKASRAFASFKPGADNDPYIDRAIKCLAYQAEKIDPAAWGLNGQLTANNAPDIVRLVAFQPGLGSVVAARLQLTITEVPAEPDKFDPSLKNWVSAALPIVEQLQARPGFNGIQLHLPEPAKYQVVIDHLATSVPGQKNMKYFRPADSVASAYSKQALTAVQTGTTQEKDIHIMAALLEMSCWEPVAIAKQVSKAIVAGISTRGIGHDSFTRGVQFMYGHRADAAGGDVFLQAIHQFGISEALGIAMLTQKDQPAAAAWCVLLFLLHDQPKFTNDEAVLGLGEYTKLLDGGNPDVAAQLADLICRYGLTADILAAIAKDGLAAKLLVAELLQRLAEMDTDSRALTADIFLAHHELLEKALDKAVGGPEEPSRYETLVTRLLALSDDSGLLAKLASVPLRPDLMHPSYLAVTNGGPASDGLARKLRDYLRDDVTKKLWLAELQKPGSWLLKTTLFLHGPENRLDLANKFSGALIGHAQRMLAGSMAVDSDLQAGWPDVLGCMSAAERELFRYHLIIKVVGQGMTELTPSLDLYGDELAVALVSAQNKKQLDGNLLGTLAEPDRGEAQQRWLILTLAEKLDVPSLPDINKEQLRSRLGEPIMAMAESADTADALREKLLALAAALGVSANGEPSNESEAADKQYESDKPADENPEAAEEADKTQA